MISRYTELEPPILLGDGVQCISKAPSWGWLIYCTACLVILQCPYSKKQLEFYGHWVFTLPWWAMFASPPLQFSSKVGRGFLFLVGYLCESWNRVILFFISLVKWQPPSTFYLHCQLTTCSYSEVPAKRSLVRLPNQIIWVQNGKLITNWERKCNQQCDLCLGFLWASWSSPAVCECHEFGYIQIHITVVTSH